MATSEIFRTIAEKNDYYLDILENGNYMVSKLDIKLKVFSKDDADKAIWFYLSKVEEKLELTEREEDEVWQYLEEMITN